MPLAYQKPMHTAGQAYISSCPTTTQFPATLTILQIIKAVMSSAAEAEIGALYINGREATPAQHTLEYLWHKQPSTPLQTHNTKALGVVNKIRYPGIQYPTSVHGKYHVTPHH